MASNRIKAAKVSYNYYINTVLYFKNTARYC